MTNYELVKEFHKKFDLPVYNIPLRATSEKKELRKRLIEEEKKELFEAMDEEDLVHIAKELADLLVVVYGTCAEYGINADKIFEFVHKSNMTKLGADGKPIYREDGKLLKGPKYVPAEKDITNYLYELCFFVGALP
jgi:predicted HAD superfamily Cof-like phosphohydrolase